MCFPQDSEVKVHLQVRHLPQRLHEVTYSLTPVSPAPRGRTRAPPSLNRATSQVVHNRSQRSAAANPCNTSRIILGAAADLLFFCYFWKVISQNVSAKAPSAIERERDREQWGPKNTNTTVFLVIICFPSGGAVSFRKQENMRN